MSASAGWPAVGVAEVVTTAAVAVGARSALAPVEAPAVVEAPDERLDPRYDVIAMVDEPRGNAYSLGQRTAGFTAAPVVRKVVMRIGPMLGIYPDANRDVDISDLEPLLWRPRAER